MPSSVQVRLNVFSISIFSNPADAVDGNKERAHGVVRRQDQWAMSGVEEDSPLHKMWTKNEVDFDLGLDKFGVEINMDAEDERAVFKNFMEDWEENCIKNKSKSNEHLLLNKYRGVRFYDDDTDELKLVTE